MRTVKCAEVWNVHIYFFYLSWRRRYTLCRSHIRSNPPSLPFSTLPVVARVYWPLTFRVNVWYWYAYRWLAQFDNCCPLLVLKPTKSIRHEDKYCDDLHFVRTRTLYACLIFKRAHVNRIQMHKSRIVTLHVYPCARAVLYYCLSFTYTRIWARVRE